MERPMMALAIRCCPVPTQNEMILLLAAFRVEGQNEYAQTHAPPNAIAAAKMSPSCLMT